MASFGARKKSVTVGHVGTFVVVLVALAFCGRRACAVEGPDRESPDFFLVWTVVGSGRAIFGASSLDHGQLAHHWASLTSHPSESGATAWLGPDGRDDRLCVGATLTFREACDILCGGFASSGQDEDVRPDAVAAFGDVILDVWDFPRFRLSVTPEGFLYFFVRNPVTRASRKTSDPRPSLHRWRCCV
ncbi:hypothetical protein MTO96_022898 [Rhipicephalus appendiculatus]